MGCKWDCANNQTTNYEPNSDITGTGVLAGFALSTYLVLILLVFYYVFVFNPESDPFRPFGKDPQYDIRPNPVDLTVGRILNKIPPSLNWRMSDKVKAEKERQGGSGVRFDTNEDLLCRCILAVSDIQIVTGIGILVSGYSSLECGLSAFHWHHVVYLAWFCSVTHLSSLTFLRKYLARNPEKRTIRLVLMGMLIILLSVALLPTTYAEWGSSADKLRERVAVCYYHHPEGRVHPGRPIVTPQTVLSVFLLVASFGIRVMKMHEFTSRVWCRSWGRRGNDAVRKVLFRTTPDESKPFALRMLVHLVWRQPVLAALHFARMGWDFYSSMTSEVYWVVVMTVWGSRNLLLFRADIDDEGRDEWSFGQVLALVILLAPAMNIFEFATKAMSRKDPKDGYETPRAVVQNGASDNHDDGVELLPAANNQGERSSSPAAVSIADPSPSGDPRPMAGELDDLSFAQKLDDFLDDDDTAGRPDWFLGEYWKLELFDATLTHLLITTFGITAFYLWDVWPSYQTVAQSLSNTMSWFAFLVLYHPVFMLYPRPGQRILVRRPLVRWLFTAVGALAFALFVGVSATVAGTTLDRKRIPFFRWIVSVQVILTLLFPLAFVAHPVFEKNRVLRVATHVVTGCLPTVVFVVAFVLGKEVDSWSFDVEINIHKNVGVTIGYGAAMYLFGCLLWTGLAAKYRRRAGRMDVENDPSVSTGRTPLL